MNIRRRLYVTAVLVPVVVSLSACGDGGKNSPAATGGTKAGPIAAEKKAAETIAEGWGDLNLRFVFDGDVPAPRKLKITGTDAAVCSKHSPTDQSLVVGSDGGLANVFVYLRPGRSETVKVHPDYESLVGQPVTLRNKGCAFTPHALTLWTQQPLVIQNDDEVVHNTKADFSLISSNESFNVQIPVDESITKHLTDSEALPIRFACSSHLWMDGYLLVRDNPYMGVSAADGTLKIANIPSGYKNFIVWHERLGKLIEVDQDGQTVIWKKGIARFAIKPGSSSTIEIKIDPKKHGL